MKDELYTRIDKQKEEITRLTEALSVSREKTKQQADEMVAQNRRIALQDKEVTQAQRKVEELKAVNKQQKEEID